MNADQHLFATQLLQQARDLTLATLRADGFPQANTVNFASDGLNIYFATDRNSRKVRNILACNRVALAVHLDYEDWRGVRGLSLTGIAEVLSDDSAEAVHARDCLVRKFREPWGSPSPDDPSTTLIVLILPMQVELLDYSKGYGHREHFTL